MAQITQKITPFLWFLDGKAEEAVEFYVSVFDNSRITSVLRNGDTMSGPNGTALTVGFQLEGQDFTAINGGGDFKFSWAVSFVVRCANQEEVDRFWARLVEGGGEHSQCGWLKDRYGLSWQITPDILIQRTHDPDPVKATRVFQAMLQMTKIDIAAVERAYRGED
ncbi:VOC family protein [Inquilinus sp. CA228]|uniref:VOC family protein n=1 Tax=Inquilinus sp. CA228 TaxID=3455609 RepID=UPI003F8D23B9